MPKNVSPDKLRVPLNCLIAPVTKTAIMDLQNEAKESQGEIVDRAVALLAFGEEIVRPPIKSASGKIATSVGGQVLRSTSHQDGSTTHELASATEKMDQFKANKDKSVNGARMPTVTFPVRGIRPKGSKR